MGNEFEQWPARERTSTVADGATGDGQVVGVGLCIARNEFAAFSNVSELDNVFI